MAAAEQLEVTRVVLKSLVPEGEVPIDNFSVKKSSIPSTPPDGGVLLEILYISVDPYLRYRMRGGPMGYQPGEPPTSGAVGLIKASKSPDFKEGEVVVGYLPWTTALIVEQPSQDHPPFGKLLTKVDPGLLGTVPLSYLLGSLGMPGLTAYVGIHLVGQPKAGEVAFISAAAGAVGQVAGQLLKKVHGCKVIGSVGSDDKVALLKELGFDAAFNYKTTDTREALKQHAPDGIDIYFENVGGETLDIVLEQANKFGRIIMCGAISQYNLPDAERYGVKNLFMLIGKEITMRGFAVFNHEAAYQEAFFKEVPQYLQEGKLLVREHVTEGIENIGSAFLDMMKGGNIGKAVVKVARQDPYPVM